MIILENRELSRKFLFLNSIRITILLVLILISVFILIFFKTPFQITPVIFLLFSAVVLSLFNFILIKFVKHKIALYFQLCIDLVVITLLVYFSGGIESPFYFLYILPIIVSAIFLEKRDTLYIATFSFIIFGIISELMYLKIIPFYPESTISHISIGTFIYNLIMSFIAFSSVAILSSYFFERIRKTGTELKNVRENLKDLALLNNTVMEKMENGFVICDSKGIIISYNEKSRKLLNLSNRSNIFDIILFQSDLEKFEKFLDKNISHYFERRINNLILGISISYLENIYSFKRIYVFIITDLTEKIRIEEQLKKKEHFALIGEMAAGIAHELRNPLASISGSVQFLKKELELKSEYENLMDIIVKESNRLSSSIEEFLNITKTTPLKESKFKLSSLIDEIIKLVRLNNKKIKFIKRYGNEHSITADKKKIEQVVWNLINNSVKAVNGNGDIEINLYKDQEDVNLSIKDNGIGMEKNDLAKIFLPFYSKFTSGIGLGMTIVKRIIEEHNFKIRISSEKNIGTEVILCFKKK